MDWKIWRAILGRRLGQRRRGCRERGAVAQRPFPFPLLEELEVRWERVVVERRLNLEDLDPGLCDEAAHAPIRRVQLGRRLVHEGLRVAHRLGIVVMTQAPIAGEAGRHALVAAVHGDEVDVDVHQEVRRGRPLVDLHVLTLVGLAQVDEVVRVLGVVLGEEAVRGERVVDAVPERVTQFLLGHAAMQGQSGDEDDVVHARLCRHVQHRLNDHLPDVRGFHRRQGQGHVVEADGELHAGAEQRRQGVSVADRVQQRVANGPVGVVDRLHRLGRVNHPAALGERLEREPLAVPEQGRWGGRVHLEDEAGSAAHQVGPFPTSNAIFTAPRRPAAPAWATASSKRVSG